MDTCFVCHGRMSGYFTKHESYKIFGKTVDRKFVKCEKCGLVIDQTTYDMTPEERSAVHDHMLHQKYEQELHEEAGMRENNRIERQASFVYQVLRTGIIPNDGRIVDYGCATGELVKYVSQLREDSRELLPNILPYDRYYQVGGGVSI